MNRARAASAIALLNPRPIAPDYVPGLGSLSPIDVAGSLAGLDRTIYCALLCKYADDLRAAQELQGRFIDWALLSVAWPAAIPLQASVVVAIAEWYSGVPCRACDGTGITPATPTSPATECETCRGVGRKPDSGRGRARKAGVPESTFSQAGGPAMIDALIRRLDELEGVGLDHVAARLFGRVRTG